jgi:hypothetical protein
MCLVVGTYLIHVTPNWICQNVRRVQSNKAKGAFNNHFLKVAGRT